jgi:hypothetical protein
LWAAGPARLGSPFPAAVRGPSPPARFDVAVAQSLRARLHAVLARTGDRLLRDLDPLLPPRDPRPQFERLLRAEVEQALGPFSVLAVGPRSRGSAAARRADA